MYHQPNASGTKNWTRHCHGGIQPLGVGIHNPQRNALCPGTFEMLADQKTSMAAVETATQDITIHFFPRFSRPTNLQ